MGKIIAISNQKGGVGKTTTAINLGAYLAILGKRILIIDSDPQGNATSGLGINKKEVPRSLYDIFLEQADPASTSPQGTASAIIQTQVANLHILPSNVHLTGTEVEIINSERREYKLKEAISSIKDNYDFIFVDSPPSLGLLTINALTAADSILIPLQCEYYALEGLTQLIDTIELVRRNLNKFLEIEGVLLTMADYRTNLTEEVIKEVKGFFKGKVYETVIPRNIKLSESPGFGKPIASYDKDSLGAQKYSDLCKEFMMRNVSREEVPRPERPALDVLTQGTRDDL